MIWKKNEVTEYSLTLTNKGELEFKVRHATYKSGPFISKEVLKLKYLDGSYSHWITPTEFNKIMCLRDFPQVDQIIPHTATTYWRGHISPDQSKALKDEMLEALRAYLQQASDDIHATYTAMINVWREHQISKGETK